MTVVVDGLQDFTVEHYRRVAFDGEGVTIGPTARAHMDRSRGQFVRLLDSDRTQFIYGVTSNFGPRARQVVPPQQQSAHARGFDPGRGSWGRGFGGGHLDQRVVRGVLFARLANFVSGSAKVRSVVAERVAALLDGPLPEVPLDGEVGAGEVLPLVHMMRGFDRGDLEEGEGGALSNGSPVAAALAADAAITGRRRLADATTVLARSLAAQGAPRQPYEPQAVRAWGDAADVAAAERLVAALPPQGAAGPAAVPASSARLVAFLGQAERALGAVDHAARTSLRSVTDNPLYLLPDSHHPLGRAVSTGGYHNAMTYPALNDLAAAWAELVVVADRHVRTLRRRPGLPPGADDPAAVLPGLVMEARAAAVPTLLPAAVNDPQDDVSAPALSAWRRAGRAGEVLDAALVALDRVAGERR